MNGREWQEPRAVADILHAFRLTRGLRRAYLSYRRNDAWAAAEGISAALSRGGFRVFLDADSVESIEPLQDVVLDELADTDILVLLDTPHALESRWVFEELVRADQLGLGVLQLIWPNHRPSPETSLCTRLQLTAADFVHGDFGSEGRLTDEGLRRVAVLAEQRASRRSAHGGSGSSGSSSRASPRVSRSTSRSVALVLRKADGGVSGSDGQVLGIALTSLGTPDARLLHNLERYPGLMGVAEDTFARLLKEDRVRVVYDGLGLHQEHLEHLRWLNEQMALKTVSVGGGTSGPPSQIYGSDLAPGSRP